MIRTITLTLLLAALWSGAVGQDTKNRKPAKELQTVSIAVESIQCMMCKKNVEKALKKVDGVESAKVEMETKVATVAYRPGTTDVASLEKAVTKAGYSANDKKPDPKAYEKLDDCCRLPEE